MEGWALIGTIEITCGNRTTNIPLVSLRIATEPTTTVLTAKTARSLEDALKIRALVVETVNTDLPPVPFVVGKVQFHAR